MPCVRCGSWETIGAHIIPKAAHRDLLKAGGQKSLVVFGSFGTWKPSQSGIIDPDLLCHPCDQLLGDLDKHAVEVVRLLGTRSETIAGRDWSVRSSRAIDHTQLARFGAAVVWRASESKIVARAGGFSLGRNGHWVRDMAFGVSTQVPHVIISRIGSTDPDLDAAARRFTATPRRLVLGSVAWARFFMNGLMFNVCTTDGYPVEGTVLSHGTLGGPEQLHGFFKAVEELEEFEEKVEQYKKIYAARSDPKRHR